MLEEFSERVDQAVWTLMRFADEPVEHRPSRQITRTADGNPRGAGGAEMGDFDRALEHLNDAADAPDDDE
jgi:hypothetical protein